MAATEIRKHVARDDPLYAVSVDIRAERRAAGLSQSQLARAAGVSQRSLSEYENGRRVPSPEVLDRIKRAFAIRPSARVDQHRDAIRALVARYHTLRPVSSAPSPEETTSPDPTSISSSTSQTRPSLLDEVGLRLALADLLRVSVDVVATDTLDRRVRERVLREAVEVRPSWSRSRTTRSNTSQPQ